MLDVVSSIHSITLRLKVFPTTKPNASSGDASVTPVADVTIIGKAKSEYKHQEK